MEAYANSVSIQKQVLSKYHSSLALTLKNIGDLYLERNDLDSAMMTYEEPLRKLHRRENDSIILLNLPMYNLYNCWYMCSTLKVLPQIFASLSTITCYFSIYIYFILL